MRRTLIDMSGPSVAFGPGTSPRFVGQYSGRSEAQSEAQEAKQEVAALRLEVP